VIIALAPESASKTQEIRHKQGDQIEQFLPFGKFNAKKIGLIFNAYI
jgi:hypothetical protein